MSDACGMCGCTQPGMPHALEGSVKDVLAFCDTVAEEETYRGTLENAAARENQGGDHPFGVFSANIVEEMNKARRKKVRMLKDFYELLPRPGAKP